MIGRGDNRIGRRDDRIGRRDEKSWWVVTVDDVRRKGENFIHFATVWGTEVLHKVYFDFVNLLLFICIACASIACIGMFWSLLCYSDNYWTVEQSVSCVLFGNVRNVLYCSTVLFCNARLWDARKRDEAQSVGSFSAGKESNWVSQVGPLTCTGVRDSPSSVWLLLCYLFSLMKDASEAV